jgi:hypothetical protein
MDGLNGLLNGPGKYSDELSLIRRWTEADGAILIIVNGRDGHGIGAQAEPELLAKMPEILETVAQFIRAQMAGPAS